MPQRANHTKPRGILIANGVLKVMVLGWGPQMIGSGQMMVRLGRGPMTYPAGQSSESWKHVETGKSLYVGLKRLIKLVER